jgi:hypothetical protein
LVAASIAAPRPADHGSIIAALGQDPAQVVGWFERVAATGFCTHPVRLHGEVSQVDLASVEARLVYSTDNEPGGVLLKACGNRRASRCPACAEVYRRDAFHLLAAGLRGGKGVPESVDRHPRVFATFTAPSFGEVHARRLAKDGRVLPCHPRRGAKTCPHGVRLACQRKHDPDEPKLGAPLCSRCYDYSALVLWNAVAPTLWHYTRIYLYRALAELLDKREATVKREVVVRYAKVAEYQRRGLIHFHAVIRLDAAPPADAPERIAPPLSAVYTATLLEAAIRQAAETVEVPVPGYGAIPARLARWGTEQLDIREIRQGGTGVLSAEQVAGYIAKYATKATESFGPALDRRIRARNLDRLDRELPAHVAALVRACWQLGGHPDLRHLHLRKWAHMLGFGGHWSTKSRRYSTTFTAIRRERIDYARQLRQGNAPLLDAWGRIWDATTVVKLGEWTYAGTGYLTLAEAQLAAALAAWTREDRSAARKAA